MGNYYEGSLMIPLKKDIPLVLKETLISLCYWQELLRKETIQIPRAYKNEDCFQHPKWYRPKFSFGFVFENEENDIQLLEYEGEGLDNEELYPKELMDTLVNYYVKINFCMKDYNGLGELYVKWLKPYMDNSFANCLGTIRDEDGTYCKMFFIDDTRFKEEITIRKNICYECENFRETSLCEHYDICKRAYDKGFIAAQEQFQENQKG